MKTATIANQPFSNVTDETGFLHQRPQYSRLTDPTIEIVIPVLNEAAILEQSITRLETYFGLYLPYNYRLTIADNGSTDGTLRIAQDLAERSPTINLLHLEQRGRGRALKTAWLAATADIVAYMDVDISTDPAAFLPMIEPLISGHAGIATGTRLHKQSQITRGVKREFISRAYNKLIKWSARTHFSDAQCGFKAVRRDVADRLLPRIADNEWFFDTELLIKAERAGVRIHEQPVIWVEDTDSRVNIVKTAIDDIRGLARVHNELDKRPWYQRLALPIVLIASGGLYLFGAMHNGMANSYYSAAVQAASQNWTAWLFGSLDAANYISIDKPPLATMIMGLSARLFGFSSFSMLLPQVLAGVGTIWLTYAAVKRQFGFASALISALTLALTPVAALMFGFNNPDGILTLLLAASAYTFLRSLEQRRPLLWLSLAGLFTGLAFNTKMLQGLMVLPAMGIVYLAFAKPPLLIRCLHVMVAGAVTTISTLWWSVLVWLTPAANRPWVGSTNDNNIWSLIFGYNGFGRLLGNGMGQGGGPGGGMGRMTTDGGGAPTMALGAPGGGGRGPGGSGFGGETGLLRIFNSDFGPNIAWLLVFALLGSGTMLWILRRTPRDNRARAAVMFWLLWLLIHIVIFSMTGGVIHPYYVVAMAPAVAALVGISLPFMWGAYVRRKRYALVLPIALALTTIVSLTILGYSNVYPWLAWFIAITGGLGTFGLALNLYGVTRFVPAAVALATIACLAAPVVYTSATITVAHTGSIPTAGPSATAMTGSNNENATANSSLVNYLLNNRNGATWIVAVASANESAAIQLTSGQPVMAVGGFNGSDSALTLSEFKQLVAEGKLRYYAVSSRGGQGGGPGGGNNEIAQWVQSNGTQVNYGGNDVTLYKL